MIADNQWHTAILYKAGGRFQIADNFEEAEKDPRVHGTVNYEEIRYNWNNGHIIIEFGDGERARIVDTIIKSDERQNS